MTDIEKAFKAGAMDKADGFYKAIKVCKEQAAKGNKECAAYVRGFENSGVGE